MGRRKLMRLGRAGASIGLTLPKEIITKLGWREKQKVTVKRRGKKIIIEDWEK